MYLKILYTVSWNSLSFNRFQCGSFTSKSRPNCSQIFPICPASYVVASTVEVSCTVAAYGLPLQLSWICIFTLQENSSLENSSPENSSWKIRPRKIRPLGKFVPGKFVPKENSSLRKIRPRKIRPLGKFVP